MKGWQKFYSVRNIEFDTGESGWLIYLASRNKTVGTAKLTLHPKNDDFLELVALEVEPSFQGLGYGTELLKIVENEFGDRYSQLFVVAQPYKGGLNREQLYNFYLRHGYTLQGTVGVEKFPVLSKPI